jgi:TRAP-type mannitol/chloroaromatic compound transport system permease small subunit
MDRAAGRETARDAGPGGGFAGAWRLALGVAAALDRPPVWIGRAAAWLLLPMVAVILFDVISRRYLRHLDWVIDSGLYRLMNSSLIQDAEWHFSAALFFLSLGYACARNVQIRLDLFRDRFSARGRVGIELAGALLLWLPFVAIIVVEAWEYVSLAFESGERSWMQTGLGRRWLIKSVLLVGYATLLMATVSLVIRTCAWLFGPVELRDEARLADVAGTQPPGTSDGMREVRE